MDYIFTDAQIKNIKLLLNAKLRNLLQTKKNLSDGVFASDNTGEISHIPTHPGDQGSQNFDQEIAMLMSSVEQQQVRDIEDAFYRIKNGTYGICENCSDAILLKRLEALPEARYCIDCAKSIMAQKAKLEPHAQESKRIPRG